MAAPTARTRVQSPAPAPAVRAAERAAAAARFAEAARLTAASSAVAGLAAPPAALAPGPWVEAAEVPAPSAPFLRLWVSSEAP